VARKSKPLPKNVLDRVKACQ